MDYFLSDLLPKQKVSYFFNRRINDNSYYPIPTSIPNISIDFIDLVKDIVDSHCYLQVNVSEHKPEHHFIESHEKPDIDKPK